jgi:hypothetical protein
MQSISLRSIRNRTGVHFPGQALLFGHEVQEPIKLHLLHGLGRGTVEKPATVPLGNGRFLVLENSPSPERAKNNRCQNHPWYSGKEDCDLRL